jgi:hypothetical protein
VASPLVCQFVIATGVPWFHFYYGSLVLSGINILLLAITYKPTLAEYAKEHRKALDVAREKLETVADAQTDSLKTEKLAHSVGSPTSSVLRLNPGSDRKNSKRFSHDRKVVLIQPLIPLPRGF